MNEVKASEGRRLAEQAQLQAATAVEWIREASASELVTESSLRGPATTVPIVECSQAYAGALELVLAGSGDVVSALLPLSRALNQPCVVLRKVPLKDAALVLAGLGATCVETAEATQLGNDAAYPGAPLNCVCLAVSRPGIKTAVRIARAEDALEKLAGRHRVVLSRDLGYERRDGGPVVPAPIIGEDNTLQFSKQLKENVEWAPGADDAVCEALADLEDALASVALSPFALRAGDIVVLDARHMLYSLDLGLPPPGTRWHGGMWKPEAAILPPADRATAPSSPLVLRAGIFTQC